MKTCKLTTSQAKQVFHHYDKHSDTFDDYMFEKFGLKYIKTVYSYVNSNYLLIYEIVCEKKYLLFLLKGIYK